MKQQEVFKRIGGIIKEINDQFEYLKTIDGALNELELELFLANSHFLADHVLILTKLNSQNSAVKKPVEKPEAPHEQNFFVPLVQTTIPQAKAAGRYLETATDKIETPVPKIDLGGSSEDSYSFMHEDEPETIRHQLVLDESDWDNEDEAYQPNTVHDALKQEINEVEPIVEREAVIIPTAAEEPKPVIAETMTVETPLKKNETEPILQKPAAQVKKEDVLTINEKMSAKLAEMAGVGVIAESHGISDLKQAITMNDKLLFIKELFNGYSLAYSEAIEILNRFNSFNEAELFLKKNYTVKNMWEKKPETANRFYALLKRRYE